MHAPFNFDVEIGMNKFTFNRGIWEKGQELPEQMENEEHFDYLERVGYSTNSVSYGTEGRERLEIFENQANHTFFALISPTGQKSFKVYIPDFPSYMLFIKDYGSSFAANGADSTQKEIMETLGKLFRAEHGHDWSEMCHLCDPVAWRRWNEAQEMPIDS